MDENGLGGIELELGDKVGELLDEDKLKRNVIALLPSIPPREDSTEQVPPVLSTTSILLSIFGWTLSPLPLPSSSLSRSSSNSSLSSLKSKPQILSCHYCLRQILVTPYLSSGEGKKSLNPLNQHYHYCPYIDTTIDTPSTTTTTSNLIKKAGWQLRLEAVLGIHSNNATYDIMGFTRKDSNTSIASTSQGGETTEVNGKSSTLKVSPLAHFLFELLPLCEKFQLSIEVKLTLSLLFLSLCSLLDAGATELCQRIVGSQSESQDLAFSKERPLRIFYLLTKTDLEPKDCTTLSSNQYNSISFQSVTRTPLS